MRYIPTPKLYQFLELLGHDPKEGKLETTSYGGFIWKYTTKKWVGFGWNLKEGVDAGLIEFVDDHPLWKLAENNELIPVEWIKSLLTQEQFSDWCEKSRGSTQSIYGVYSSDVKKYLQLSGLQ